MTASAPGPAGLPREPTREPVTGLLLVGGASARFGSPKALARLGAPGDPPGETLAERAWRTLATACDEVLAVGKAADALPLPFTLVDDGSELRVPIVGLAAGLRAARHELCVVLPVDCPLVDAAVVRALAAACPPGVAAAHPASGPVPGAWRRSALPALEAEIASGRLSMWRALDGLRTAVAPVDEALLADADDPEALARLAARAAGGAGD